MSNYSCKLCYKTFLNEAVLTNHYRDLHNIKHEMPFPIQEQNIYNYQDKNIYNCHMCDKSFSRESSLYIHYINIHNYTRFHCSECQKTFKTQQDLDIHFENYHKHFYKVVKLYFG